MKEIKFIVLLIIIGGMFSCGQKKESDIDSIENIEIVHVEIPRFSNQEMQRYITGYDELIDQLIEMHENNEFQSEEGKKKLEKFKIDIEKYEFKMNSILEKSQEEKELQKFQDYFEVKQNQIRQKTGNLIIE